MFSVFYAQERVELVALLHATRTSGREIGISCPTDLKSWMSGKTMV